MSARRPRVLAAILGLSVLAGGCGGEDARPARVVVRVVDPEGRPVPEAKVQALYAPGWRPTGAAGTVGYDEVPLRAGEAETPEAVAAAFDVRAPFHGRHGRAPRAARDPRTGRVQVEFVLERHGVLRVSVARTRFETARAWVEPDPVLRRVEAMDGVEVARSGGGAAWRVFPGLDEVTVHLRGEEGMAWRRLVLPAPAPGFLREVTFVPEGAREIAGVVRVAEGDLARAPATGRVEVDELLADGSRRALPPVRVEPDGAFAVPYAGPGRYALRPVLDFYEVPGEATADGGGFVEVADATPRPVVRVRVPGLSPAEREAARVEGGGAWRWEGETLLAVRPEGAAVLEVRVPGTDAHPPKAARVALPAPGEGDPPAPARAEPLPHGRVVVRLADVPPTGAAVRLGDRERTVLPGLAAEATFEHVPAGDVEVRVAWRGRAALVVRRLALAEGATLGTDAAPAPGTAVLLEGRGPGLARDAAARLLTVTDDASPLPRGTTIRFERRSGEALWATPEPLPPGTWRVRIAAEGADGPGADAVLEVAGASLRVPLEVP